MFIQLTEIKNLIIDCINLINELMKILDFIIII
jgi:hypothetical protein